MSLRDAPGLVLLSLLLWTTHPSHAQWCRPTCEGVTVSGTKVIDPSNCLQYYVCSDNGQGSLQLSNPIECNPGEFFDHFLTTPECVPIADAHVEDYCSGYCNPCLPYCDTVGLSVPDPEDPTKYYICLDGPPLQMTCPTGQYFEYEAFECGPNADKTFEFCDRCESYCVEAGKIPDPYDGCSYYVCDPPEKVSFPCPDDERFNSATYECEQTFPGVCLTKCP